MISEIYNAKTGDEAVRKANKSDRTEYEIRDSLYLRISDKVGPKVFSFTPRVANIWYDYFPPSPHVKVAALTLAASQDNNVNAEKHWDLRLDVAKKVIDTFGVEVVNHVLSDSLINLFEYNAIARDFSYLFRAVERRASFLAGEQLASSQAAPELEEYEFKHDADGKFDNWFELLRKRN